MEEDSRRRLAKLRELLEAEGNKPLTPQQETEANAILGIGWRDTPPSTEPRARIMLGMKRGRWKPPEERLTDNPAG